jgi:hypothetical protein
MRQLPSIWPDDTSRDVDMFLFGVARHCSPGQVAQAGREYAGVGTYPAPRLIRLGFCALLLLALQGQTVHADGSGHVTFRRSDGHVYRTGVQVDSTPQDVSAVLDTLAPGGVDEWLATSHDGSRLLLNTQRWDPECAGWGCLAVVNAELTNGRAVHAGSGAAVVHADGFSAIAHDGRIVFPQSGGPHTQDLWRLDPSGNDWTTAVLLTRESPFQYNTEPALSLDETRVVFGCGDQPYAVAGTALCEVALDGSGLRVVLGPSGVQPELAGAATLDHPTYASDGSIVFSADRDGTQVWRIPAGGGSPTVVASVFKNDNRPCVLPNGSIASQWLSEAVGGDTYLLKVMLPSDRTFVTPTVGDMAPETLGCGA